MKHHAKGRKIQTIVNEIFYYHKDFPSLTHKQEKLVRINAKHQQIKKRSPQLMENSSETTHKILIIGDSHARNCANLLQDNLSVDFKV